MATFDRDSFGVASLVGLPVRRVDDLLLIRSLHDLRFDGWTLFRLFDVSRMRWGMSGTHGAIEATQVAGDALVTFTSLADFLSKAHAAGLLAGIHLERHIGEDAHCGRLLETDGSSGVFELYSPLRSPDRHYGAFWLDDITRVEVASSYLTTYAALRERT